MKDWIVGSIAMKSKVLVRGAAAKDYAALKKTIGPITVMDVMACSEDLHIMSAY